MISWKDDPRANTNPVFNDNKLKLGLFGLNTGSNIMTKAPDRYVASWPRTNVTSVALDYCGLEVMCSLMSWLPTPELEPFTWAAGVAAITTHPMVLATMHMPLNHPVFVARAAATIDQISGGRCGLNLVAGANPATFAPFGVKMEDHETRYAHAAEWVELLKRLWTATEPFDFQGQYYQAKRALSLPKPVQSMPVLMNAGTSGRGQQFACKYADLVFTHPDPDDNVARVQLAEIKQFAQREFGRDVQVWTHGYTIIRDTEQEAEDFLNYFAHDHADHEAVSKWTAAIGAAAQDPSIAWKYKRHWAAGGGTRVVGTPDQVADRLRQLSDIGFDGIMLNSIEPERLARGLATDLLPRLEQMGLRRPAKLSVAQR